MNLKDPVPAYVLWLGPTGLTIARALGRRGIPVVGVHHDPNEPCTGCRYARLKILPPLDHDEKAWLDFLVEEGKALAPRKAVLLVASDAHWLFVARNRRVLEQYFHFSLPGPGDVSAWLSKPFQYEAADRAGVPHPHTIIPRTMADIMHAADRIVFPCLLKPALSHLWSRVYARKLSFVQTPQQLIDQGADALNRGLEFMITEYIPAEDNEVYGYFACLDRSLQPLGYCVSRKLRQFEPRFGSSCYSVSVTEPEVERLGLRMMQEMKCCGIGDAEFKRDPRDGQFKLMEINMRAPLMMAVVQDSGVDLCFMAYCDLCGLPQPEPKRVRLGKRVGILAHDIYSSRFYRKMGRLSLWPWLWSWMRARDIHFAWDDLEPARGYFWMMLDQWKRGKYSTLPDNFPPASVFESMQSQVPLSLADENASKLASTKIADIDSGKPGHAAVTAAADRYRA